MKRSRWHLDLNLPPNLFGLNWSQESTLELHRLFRMIDESEGPVLSMLPAGVSPAGAAAAAALYFLPGIAQAPTPPCRIALYPGLHFVHPLKHLKFQATELQAATGAARSMMRGYPGFSKPMLRFQKTYKELGEVNFHWLWRCQRIWTRYRSIQADDLAPRSYFGREDTYEALIHFIETDDLERLSSQFKPYDLLIYYPAYHSRGSDYFNDDMDRVLQKLSAFHADRKLLVVRSPYDYWARRLESALKLRGIALPATRTLSTQQSQNPIQFIVVDQVLNISEAAVLFDSINRASRISGADRHLINELKYLLMRLLVSLKPDADGQSLGDLTARLSAISPSLGIDAEGMFMVTEVCERVRNKNFVTKLAKIEDLLKDGQSEVWVTKDGDRAALADFMAARQLEFPVTLVDRRFTLGKRSEGKKVILTRLDREGDLDLVTYLREGDVAVMSAWEAVIRSGKIQTAWERSDRWREQAVNRGIISKALVRSSHDPVLELADFIDSAVTNHTAATGSPASTDEESWWDRQDQGTNLDSGLTREQVLSIKGDTIKCVELQLEDDFGIFLNAESEVQIIPDPEEGEEFVTVPVTEVRTGHTLLLFKDEERGSIFDILMDAMEKSDELSEDAKKVREWKHALRIAYHKNPYSLTQLPVAFGKFGVKVIPQTVRSWVFGPTMAPQQEKTLVALIDFFKIPGVDAKSLFASVKKLRTLSRTLGRVLNHWIVKRELDSIDPKMREMVLNAGIDVEELAGVIEARLVTGYSRNTISVDSGSVKKMFKFNYIGFSDGK